MPCKLISISQCMFWREGDGDHEGEPTSAQLSLFVCCSIPLLGLVAALVSGQAPSFLQCFAVAPKAPPNANAKAQFHPKAPRWPLSDFAKPRS